MRVQTTLPVQNGDTLGAIRGFLRSLFEQRMVDAMLVPLEVPSADQVTPILVHEQKALDTANPLAPVMRVNAAAILARVQQENAGTRLAAVLRPCEIRAAVELAKVGRIDLNALLMIGIDCMGTYEAGDYAQIARASADSPTDEMMRWTRQGPIAPYRLRNACQMCEHFVPENADIVIGMIGMNVRERLVIDMRTDIADKIGAKAAEANGRDKAIARLSTIRHHRREEALGQASALLTDLPGLVALVAGCTACGECQDACPYCNTDAFAPKPAQEPHTDRVRVWPSGEGRTMRERQPGVFGELVRMGRRAASCVGCGMCESSCSRHVPLTAIQAVLGSKVQEAYKYVPGMNLQDRLPWARG